MTKESRLWLYFPRAEDVAMELRLRPFTFPGSPLQTVKLYVNGKFFRELPLQVKDWQSYTVHLPRTYLTTGINTFRFVYSYIDSPSRVEPGNRDNSHPRGRLRLYSVSPEMMEDNVRWSLLFANCLPIGP